MMKWHVLVFIATFFAASFGVGPAHGQQVDVAAAWEESARLEASGDPAGAATSLEPVVALYPQDFATNLQLGWLYFKAADYPRAEHYYGVADDLAGEAGIARLGLGWTYLRQGKRAEARAAFETYLTANPDAPATAPEGLALLDETVAPAAQPVVDTWFGISFSPVVHRYIDHVSKDTAFGGRLGAEYGNDGLWLAGSYAYNRFELKGTGTANQALFGQTGGGFGNGGGGTTDAAVESDTTTDVATMSAGNRNGQEGPTFGEHMVIARVGYGGRYGGLIADGAYANNDGALHGELFAAGLTARLSLWNDLYVGALTAKINGYVSYQSRVAYDIHLASDWWVTPYGMVEYLDERDVLGAGGLSFSRRAGQVRGFVAGRYGRTFHEVDFGAALVASHDDDVVWAMSAGLSYWPTTSWSLGGIIAAEGYGLPDGTDAGTGLFGGLTVGYFWFGGD